MTNTALNRTTIVQLTNKSGSSLAQGAVVVIDRDTDNSFETITTSGYTTTNIGVVFEPNGIVADAVGGVALAGWVPKILVSGTANRGYYLRTSPEAGEAYQFGSAGVGDFGITLENGDSPEAFLFGNTTQSTGGAAATSDVLYSNGTELIVENSTTETTLYDYTVTNSNIETGGFFSVNAKGYLFNNTGSDQTFTIKFYSNGTTIHTATITNFPSGTADSFWELNYDVQIFGRTGTSVVLGLFGSILVGHKQSQQINNTRNFFVPFVTGGSITLTPDMTIKATITNGTASASMDFAKETVIIRGPY